MKTTEEIKAKIKKFEDIGQIVLSMKSIASLNVQNTQRQIQSLRDYEEEITSSLKMLLSYYPNITLGFEEGKKAIIVYGSDQGLCGLFNERIAKFVSYTFKDYEGLIVIGKKLDDTIQDNKLKSFAAPVNYETIYSYASELLEYITEIYVNRKINEIYVAYNQFLGIGKYRSVYRRIIPFEIEREEIFKFPPVTDVNPERILSDLIVEYIFSNIYRSYLESFLSENSVRLMNMNNASKAIEKNIKKLEIEKNYYRQEEITNEIQEILTAYKVLTGEG